MGMTRSPARKAVVSVQPPITPTASSALMVRPAASRSISRSSRDCLNSRAMRSMAQSHALSSQRSLPGARYRTLVSRRSFTTLCFRVTPLGHSVPRLIG